MSLPIIEMHQFSKRPKHEQDEIIRKYMDIKIEQGTHAKACKEWLIWFMLFLFAAFSACGFLIWFLASKP